MVNVFTNQSFGSDAHQVFTLPPVPAKLEKPRLRSNQRQQATAPLRNRISQTSDATDTYLHNYMSREDRPSDIVNINSNQHDIASYKSEQVISNERSRVSKDLGLGGEYGVTLAQSMPHKLMFSHDDARAEAIDRSLEPLVLALDSNENLEIYELLQQKRCG